MADVEDPGPLPGIAALPPTTVRQLGSAKVLVDPSSVVKELIDNALDARAKGIWVDISANTIDLIQVKDDGHGIPAEDRALVCRRYCTSKIRDFNDLKGVGGNWLGFCGEAMASMAEMSEALAVTTRVEGESVAVRLSYDRNGKIGSNERASHPVGTTVKVTGFFKAFPVREAAALKESTKWLAKIRRLVQSYALGRPSVRIRLHILNVKNGKGDFIYAPKANFNIEDAALKVVGKDCALQCDWTALESDDFEVHALLPKAGASGPKIANHGAFISIDSRPVSASRGTPKQIVKSFKQRLCKANRSRGPVKDPFFYLNVICPPASYDPNIEPAKDDVLFEDADTVLKAVDKLLVSYYTEALDTIDDTGDAKQSMPAQCSPDVRSEQLRSRPHTPPFSIREDLFINENRELSFRSLGQQPRRRPNMHDIDEGDLKYLSKRHPSIIEEEEGLRAIGISNPWTIARMNTTFKPKKPVKNNQLLTPTRGPGDIDMSSSSAVPDLVPNQPPLVTALTPQTSSKLNMLRSPDDHELKRSIRGLTSSFGSQNNGGFKVSMSEGASSHTDEKNPSVTLSDVGSIQPSSPMRQGGSNMHTHAFLEDEILSDRQTEAPEVPFSMIAPAPTVSRRFQRKKQANRDQLLNSPISEANDTWLGQPIISPLFSSPQRRSKGMRNQGAPFSGRKPSSPRRAVPNAAQHIVENDFYTALRKKQRSTTKKYPSKVSS